MRWAVVRKFKPIDDVRELEREQIISVIETEGGRPSEPRSKDCYLVQIPVGVQVGMVRGGQFNKAGPWGFLDGPAELARPKRAGVA